MLEPFYHEPLSTLFPEYVQSLIITKHVFDLARM